MTGWVPLLTARPTNAEQHIFMCALDMSTMLESTVKVKTSYYSSCCRAMTCSTLSNTPFLAPRIHTAVLSPPPTARTFQLLAANCFLL